jgi:hypothetical protein
MFIKYILLLGLDTFMAVNDELRSRDQMKQNNTFSNILQFMHSQTQTLAIEKEF